jgi:L-ascorbate metabolism protein UlaG (beta-lactamase superfamily)
MEEVGKVDAVLLSHEQHLDNFDHSGRAFVKRAGTVFTTPASAKQVGKGAQGLSPFDTATLTGQGGRAFITATPARHGPVGFEPISGDVAGFLIGVARPGDAVYVTGDTVWYEGVAEVAERFSPKLVIAFAGSAKPRGPFHVTMDNNDLIATAHAFPQARVVAVHNNGWAHFTESQADAFKAFGALGLTERLVALEPGKPVTLTL